nr:12379_t:CDS:1 [Entrophospora candida]
MGCFNSDSSTMYKGSFSYKNNNIFVVNIDDNNVQYQARVEKINQNVARIYFVNNNGIEIPIPACVSLRDTTNNEDVNPYGEDFLIAWTSNYTFFLNSVELFRLENQKQQAVMGTQDVTTFVIQQ